VTVVPGLPDTPLSDASLYDVLETRFGIVFDAGEQTIEAGIADAADARLLDLARGSAVLLLQRRSFMNGTCVELAVSTYRADRYQLHSALEIPRRNRVPSRP
jgi:GntR family transcriptional regulator